MKTAMESYWREGVHTLGLNEICRRTGLSKPSLYREFGGEDGLMAAALDQYRVEVVVPLLGLLATDRPFAEVLDELVCSVTEHHGRPAGCLFARMRSAPSRLGPITTKRVESLREEWRAAFAAWYERAASRGEVNPAIPRDLAASFLDAQLTNVLTQVALGESAEVIRAQAALAFRGLLPAGAG